MRRALVLGGGGVAGIAWETGVLAGLASAGVDVSDADVVVGTSAGSLVGAWLGRTRPEELYRRVVDAPLPGGDLVPAASLRDMTALFLRLDAETSDGREWRRRVGESALAAETVPEAARREVFATRLRGHDWPAAELVVVAVDARTGDRRAFRRGDADLVDAVTASCALPLLWPPATVGGTRYVDGGIHSVTNADLADGCDRVLVLAPVTDRPLTGQAAALREKAGVRVIERDAAADAAIGDRLRDPATRVPAARAGYAQGVAEASAVAGLWG